MPTSSQSESFFPLNFETELYTSYLYLPEMMIDPIVRNKFSKLPWYRRIFHLIPRSSVFFYSMQSKATNEKIHKNHGVKRLFYSFYLWYLQYSNLRFDNSLNLARINLLREQKKFNRPNPFVMAFYPTIKAFFSQLAIYILIVPIEIISLVCVAVNSLYNRDAEYLFYKIINAISVLLVTAFVIPNLYGFIYGLLQTPEFLILKKPDEELEFRKNIGSTAREKFFKECVQFKLKIRNNIHANLSTYGALLENTPSEPVFFSTNNLPGNRNTSSTSDTRNANTATPEEPSKDKNVTTDQQRLDLTMV